MRSSQRATKPAAGRDGRLGAGAAHAGRTGMGIGLDPASEQLLELQRTAGNRAVTSLLASVQRDDPNDRRPIAVGGGETRQPIAAGGGTGTETRRPIRSGGWETPKSAAAAAVPHGGTELDLIGVVDQDGTNPGKDSTGQGGVNLRPEPGTDNTPLGRLDDRDHVVAKRDMEDGWLYVVATGGHTWGGGTRGGSMKGTAGYVKASAAPGGKGDALVNFDLPPDRSAPDPDAFLYRIPAGRSAQGLVREAYGPSNIETGQDERFFTNVLKYLNDQAKRGAGIVPGKTTKHQGIYTWEEDDLKLVAGRQIWIPGLEMAQSLKGTVSRGSWMRNAAERIKGWAKKAASIPLFIAGLAVGALESIRDFFVGLFDLVWNAIKTLGGSLVDAAKAIWGLITDPRKRGSALEALQQELEDLVGDKVSFLRKAYNWGRIVGYLTMEVVSAILAGGAIEAAKAGKFGARLAKFAKAVGELEPVKAVTSRANAIAKSKVGQQIAELVAPAGKVVKKAGTVVDAVAGAPGRAVLKTAEVLSERAVALGSRYGWSAKRLERLAQITEKYGVKLYLRKSSKYAPMRMAEGAVAKPAVIKANTLNDDDLLISSGFTEKDLGLVAHFDPLPKEKWHRPAGVSDDAWTKRLPSLEKQAAKRAKSFRKLDKEMKRLGTPKKHGDGESYTIEGGLVKQVEQGANGEKIVRPLTSDIDVFAGANRDGSKLGAKYDQLDDALLEADFSEHGFHTEWRHRGDFDPDAFYSIIEAHLDDPLIEVGPDLVERAVTAREIPEVAEILNSSGYKRWKRGRMQKAFDAGVRWLGIGAASAHGASARRDQKR
ncbi:MAG TPA: hypothetical protein VFI15_01155 [Candidatus Limnocylindrales bacterium]|nr:hypothetical protein [Candidatus Limnocylindrales bacterium]